MVRGNSLTLSSSVRLGWRHITVERHRAEPGEREELAVGEIFIKVARGSKPSFGERLTQQRNSICYAKEPGTIFLYSDGVLPLVRPRTETELLVCRLNRNFLVQVAEEVGRRPSGLNPRPDGFRDSAIRQLIELLERESASGGESGLLYVEHLTYALTLRLCALDSRIKMHLSSTSALPAPRLRRVIDRMQNAMSSDLDLRTLAAESGYSRNHFLRLFRAATGHTPHQYLLRLRVERAKEMLRKTSLDLIDVALECGFSNHTHFSRMFRQLVGATPSEYRRESSQQMLRRVVRHNA